LNTPLLTADVKANCKDDLIRQWRLAVQGSGLDYEVNENENCSRILVTINSLAEGKVLLSQHDTVNLKTVLSAAKHISDSISSQDKGKSSRSELIETLSIMEEYAVMDSHQTLHSQRNSITISRRFARPDCATEPAIIDTPFLGKLLLGTIDYRLSKEWLQKQGVSLCVNCIGKHAGADTITEHWSVLHCWQHSHPWLQRIDWCPNNERDWIRAATVFGTIGQVLRSGGCVYVHCVNGRDRSPFMVFCFLRSYCHLSQQDAFWALRTRVGKRGTCIAKLDRIPVGQWQHLAMLLQRH
jgi:hypothetical protein